MISAQCLIEEKLRPQKNFIRKLILGQSWLSKPTDDWLLELEFSSEMEVFKIWSDNIVSLATQGNMLEAVDISNV